jgi:recombination protein RecA
MAKAKKSKGVEAVREEVKKVLQKDILVEDPPVAEWLSTGSTLVDIAVANQFPGGIPMGRMTEIYAPPSAGKSVIGMTLTGEMQRRGGVVWYYDVEGTFDYQWSELYGIDLENTDTFRLASAQDGPLTIEEFFDEDLGDILKLSKTDTRPKLIILDTLAALSYHMEQGKGLGEGHAARRALLLSEAYRKYSPAVMHPANMTIVFLNQVRQLVGGQGFGKTTKAPGGNAKDHMVSVRIWMKHIARLKNSKDIVKGVDVAFDVEKNKVGPPFGSGTFPIMFDYGLDDVASCCNFLKRYQEGNKKGFLTFNKKEKQPATMIKYVENESLESKLREEVWEMWKEIHKPSTRKPRDWSK